jgi:hypothetical protein
MEFNAVRIRLVQRPENRIEHIVQLKAFFWRGVRGVVYRWAYFPSGAVMWQYKTKLTLTIIICQLKI